MKFPRRKSRQVQIGGVAIGGNAPISIQSMTTSRTADVEATVSQIIRLSTVGCELVRVAIFDEKDAKAIEEVISRINIPLIADIHFDYRLALAVIERGVHGLRINPGNIGDKDRVKQVVDAARERNIPIRIGVNSGSLEKSILEKFCKVTAKAMVESAMGHVRILEDLNYPNLKVSLKASSPMMTLKANRLFAEECDYPIHLGVTEAGPPVTGAIKSATALSLLLAEGIGDTIRISLTADPVEEVRAAKALLEAMDLREQGLRVVSCPTCGRCQVEGMIELAQTLEKRLSHITAPITLAVMGCAVNGPGEASEADIGIAMGKGRGLLFKHGEKVGVVPADQIEATIVDEVEKLAKEMG